MKEAVLQFIWEKQLFQGNQLKTTSGKTLQIVSPGVWNLDQGPDFSQAIVIIDHLKLIGSIEIHLKSSDWIRHRHTYNNVVLHVVLIHDQELLDTSGFQLPVLELHHRIQIALIPKILALTAHRNQLKCTGYFHPNTLHDVGGMLQQAGLNRLNERAENLKKWKENSSSDWEQLARYLLFQTAGLPQNIMPMEALFSALPWNKLTRKSPQEVDWLSILMGVSGLKLGSKTTALQQMQANYSFWKKLLNLESLQPHLWKTSRMRPAFRPEKRLSQLAVILGRYPQTSVFLSEILDSILDPVSTASGRNVNYLKTTWRQTILVNAAIPFRRLQELEANLRMPDASTAIMAMRLLPAEDNRYTRMFNQAGVKLHNALESQGVIAHFRQYCHPGACISCKIATRILQTDPG